VTNVVDLTGTFYNCYSFSWDLGNWSVSRRCKSMDRMFYGAWTFESQDLGRWDTSSVNTTFAMFRFAYNFNGDVSKWDLSNVRDCSRMFEEAESFNGDLSSWKSGNATTMAYMFTGAVSFNSDISR